MTLTLLVVMATIFIWLLLLICRWLIVLPLTEETYTRTVVAAVSLSGALVGGAYPIGWILVSNLLTWQSTGVPGFRFASHLPPGVDEDELLIVLVVGLLILIGQAFKAANEALRCERE
jgi:hypothetical protein